jgi:hypothetical protein
MSETGAVIEATSDASPVASSDAAWIEIAAPLPVARLAAECRDLEALYRINPYLYFKTWRRTGPGTFHAEFRNESNQQDVVLDLRVHDAPGHGFTVEYAQGLKRRTVFAFEPFDGGSRLTITDDYEGAPAEERERRAEEVDKSLPAWGAALRVYFLRLKRWSWLPGWRGYTRRLWIPMKPSARRIVWLLYLITVVEFFFFLFVLLIYLLEQHR